MAYPSSIDIYQDKLNRKQDDSTYVIEEQLSTVAGVYEGVLAHDHIRRESIRIYTGPGLSGEEVIQYFLTVPSETPWKLIIKVFSSAEVIYVTYETPGDRVEAEDINRLQDSMTAVQTELDRYKDDSEDQLTAHHQQLDQLEAAKADKVFVDEELLSKADKTNTYTKEQTDERIQTVIGAAPEALDTLQELAQALDNDPDFAATMTTQLAGKVDKAAGKQLSTEDYTTAEKAKLAGIAAGANLYVHPSAHPAAMITQDAAHRFVSDTEKSAWQAKESVAGAQAKVDAHASDADKHITVAERDAWNAKQEDLGFTPEDASRRGAAGGYAELDANGKIPDHRISSNFVTQSQLGDVGYGDMTKAVYDSNNNGRVDQAEAADSVPWAGVTGRPSTFPPAAHTHNVLGVQADNARDGLALPSAYERGVTTFFSSNPANKFNGVSYGTVMTIKGYSNMAAVQYLYPYNVDAPISYRYALYNSDSWREWRSLAVAGEVMPRGPLTWNQVKGV
ncbi:DUF4795 domain-containing protein [Paenibacillus sp. 1P07SE]|uniref:DUF4795 domain-containing protein n=1 Tax=Paenibacillus sp. 1P07SE TaxID=3132209 RepID=UPI0039A57B1E